MGVDEEGGGTAYAEQHTESHVPVGAWGDAAVYGTAAGDELYSIRTTVYEGGADDESSGCEQTSGTATVEVECGQDCGEDCADCISGSLTDEVDATVFPDDTHTCVPPGRFCALVTDTLSGTFSFDAGDKAEAVASLPAYSGTFSSGNCSAYALFSDGGVGRGYPNITIWNVLYSIQRFKYKFQFPDPGSGGYLKILWNETYKPTLAVDVDYCGTSYSAGAEDPDPTNWVTTPRFEEFGSGDTESTVYEIIEPSSVGTIYLTDIRWTNVEGCDPLSGSIEGIDQFASSERASYLCNDFDPGNANCTCP